MALHHPAVSLTFDHLYELSLHKHLMNFAPSFMLIHEKIIFFDVDFVTFSQKGRRLAIHAILIAF